MKNNKKGFTLAELLIVVAIIAVLVAIAVPLFVGALTKAQKATEDANIRAVRGAAKIYSKDSDGVYKLIGPWKAVATLSNSGEISEIKVSLCNATEAPSGTLAETSKDKCVKKDTGYEVTVFLTPTQLTAAAVTG